jgi:hypothetical protein
MTRKYKTYLVTSQPSARPLAGAGVGKGLASGDVTVTGGVTPLFSDGFERDITRSGTSVAQSAMTAYGWANVKAYNFGTYPDGPYGFIYTTDCPAPRTGRALAVEAVGSGGETDFYVQYGTAASPANFLPDDLWITFWCYSVPGSTWEGGGGSPGKFFYPSRDGNYPVSGAAASGYGGLLLIGSANFLEGHSAPAGGFYFGFRAADGAGYYVPWGSSEGTKLHQNVGGDQPFLAGTWYQVKWNLRLVLGQPGRCVMWRRTSAGAAWTQFMNWDGGSTPDFVWPLNASTAGGHRAFKIPTVIKENNTILLDDFNIYNADPG